MTARHLLHSAGEGCSSIFVDRLKASMYRMAKVMYKSGCTFKPTNSLVRMGQSDVKVVSSSTDCCSLYIDASNVSNIYTHCIQMA